MLIFFGLALALFYVAGLLIRPEGLIGFDWVHFFGRGGMPPYYPPWDKAVIDLLTWPLLVGLTLASIALAGFLRAVDPLSFLPMFLSLPVLWTVFLGQIDGLMVMGLLGLPFLAPLALLKPQVSLFAFFARPSWILALLVTLIVSMLTWGPWPADLLSIWTVHVEGYPVNDISLGGIGLPFAIVLLWFSRGDPDMLMASGVFGTLFLLPYNLIVLVPAMARLRPWKAWVAAGLSWLTLSANWLGPAGWWLEWTFVIWIWSHLAHARYRGKREVLQLSEIQARDLAST